jgi:hypothetical protein
MYYYNMQYVLKHVYIYMCFVVWVVFFLYACYAASTALLQQYWLYCSLRWMIPRRPSFVQLGFPVVDSAQC